MKRLLSFISALAMAAAVCTSCGKEDMGAESSEDYEMIIPDTKQSDDEDTSTKPTKAQEITIPDSTQPGDEAPTDALRKHSSTTTIENSKYPEITAVTVSAVYKGNIRDPANVIEYTSNVLYNGVEGRVGTPVKVEIDEDISRINIAFEYNADELRGIPPKNLIILRYIGNGDSYDTIKDISLDEDSCTVSADISEGGVYILADAYQWYSCWGYDASEYKYDNDPSEYATDWERQGSTGSIMELADKEWAVENAPEFHVSTAEQLASVVWYVNGVNDDKSVSVYLENDIDLTGYDWKPMGWTNAGITHKFSGSLDGQGHTINGMTISCGYEDTGFIGYGLGVYVRDISFTNADVSGTGCTGIVGGQLYISSNWSNVHAQGKVSGGEEDYGAIVGRETDIIFKDCTADVTVDGKPFKYLSYKQKRIDDAGDVVAFHIEMNDDKIVTRDEPDGEYLNLCWNVYREGEKVEYTGAGLTIDVYNMLYRSGNYEIYLTAYINGAYIPVSNVIEYKSEGYDFRWSE